jgi:hypothetical protein
MSEQVILSQVTFEYTDANTPTKPEAVKGAFSLNHLAETREQLDQRLIWARCSFCGGYVLIDSSPLFKSRSREQCKCGAKRISRYVWRKVHGEREAVGYEDGWRKNGVEWTSL